MACGGPGARPEAPEERPDNDAPIFFIMEILASQLIPSELSSSSHKLSYEPRKS